MEAQYGENLMKTVFLQILVFAYFFFWTVRFWNWLKVCWVQIKYYTWGECFTVREGKWFFSWSLKSNPWASKTQDSWNPGQCFPTLRPQKTVEMELELILTHAIILKPMVNKSPIKKNISFLSTFSSCTADRSSATLRPGKENPLQALNPYPKPQGPLVSEFRNFPIFER